MTLREKQSKFVHMVSLLISYAYMRGYELTFGDAYRDPRVFGESHVNKENAYGRKNSNHKLRLAIDFNLFVDNKFITNGSHPAYVDLGEFWESIGGSWGGRYKDANHFSLEHNGRK